MKNEVYIGIGVALGLLLLIGLIIGYIKRAVVSEVFQQEVQSRNYEEVLEFEFDMMNVKFLHPFVVVVNTTRKDDILEFHVEEALQMNAHPYLT
jgi:hypothetical protein